MAVDRRRRPLTRDAVNRRDARLFIVATEGQETEPLYFRAFRSSRMQVVPLPSEDGRSSPEHVLRLLDGYARRFDLGEEDELWLVIDRDRWPVKALSGVQRACRQKRVGFAVSNPNFEIWLALHVGDLPDPTTEAAVRAQLVAALGGYRKNSFDAERLSRLAGDAVVRARGIDTGENAIWPDPPGSRVYLMMERVLALLDDDG